MSRMTSVLIAFAFLLPAHQSTARRNERSTDAALLSPSSSGLVRTPASDYVIKSWNFDNDPPGQEWTPVDRTDQPAYFHIDTLGAIQGSQSLWCGADVCATPNLCTYATLPGYGNNWDQVWESTPFTPTAGELTVSFHLTYDTEPSYDFVDLEYSTAPNVWSTIHSWSGLSAGSSVTRAISTSSPTRVRLRFHSDASWSDEDGILPTDGGCRIDSLAISGATVSDFHDFESETTGATQTADGRWQSYPSAYGDHAAIFDGDNVLQEDADTFNHTNMWGFFAGSSDNYACGGHPEQAVVPFEHESNVGTIYIKDEIQSPPVSIAALPPGERLLLSFDMYPDIPAASGVSFSFRLRSKVGGVWRWDGGIYPHDAAKTWKTITINLGGSLAGTATDLQFAIGVFDEGGGSCHSHGPLIDNVRLTRANTSIGNNVVLQPGDETTGTSPVTLTFSHVSVPGLTSLSTSTTGPPPPGAFQIGNGTYYDVNTTARTTGTIQLCINYDEGSLTVPEGDLRILHLDTDLNPDAWVDVTTSLNTATNTICCTTTHLSPFVIGSGSVTAVGNSQRAFALHQNVPNPFNPATSITYEVPGGGAKVSIRIYDASGRLVRTLVDSHRTAGVQTVTWDGRDGFGAAVSSGVYFYKMVAGTFSESRRMVLLK